MSTILRIVVVLTVALAIAMPATATWTTVHACAADARTLLANAEPQDRNPPPQVLATIKSLVPVKQMPELLAHVLLVRYACDGYTGTSWPTDQPALAWWLRNRLTESEQIALYATTAQVAKDQRGLAVGARKMYGRELTDVTADQANCLVRRDRGMTPLPDGQPIACPSTEGIQFTPVP